MRFRCARPHGQVNYIPPARSMAGGRRPPPLIGGGPALRSARPGAPLIKEGNALLLLTRILFHAHTRARATAAGAQNVCAPPDRARCTVGAGQTLRPRRAALVCQPRGREGESGRRSCGRWAGRLASRSAANQRAREQVSTREREGRLAGGRSLLVSGLLVECAPKGEDACAHARPPTRTRQANKWTTRPTVRIKGSGSIGQFSR